MEKFTTEKNILITALRQLGIADAEIAAEKMLAYSALVLKRNEIINLTAITEPEEFVRKHLIDSVLCCAWPEIVQAQEIVDVGTGAGFPGVPLAILFPKKNFVLMDSLGKRVSFLEEAARETGLENVRAVKCRAEDAGRDKNFREHFDLCVCRALARLSVLSEYCLPLLKVGGSLYAYKTGKAIPEIEDSELARHLLGGSKEVDVRPVSSKTPDAIADAETGRRHASVSSKTPDGCCRGKIDPARVSSKILDDAPVSEYGLNIMVITKEHATPDSYPRKAGTPERTPL